MLSPLRPSEQEPYSSSVINYKATSSLQTYNSSGISSTYQYPTKAQFFSTPSIDYKRNNDFKNNLKQFQFSVFDVSQARNYKFKRQEQQKEQRFNAQALQIKKPEPFMGAFLQTQTQFDCFKLNVRIPSLRQAQPFSRILSQSIFIQKEQKQPQAKQQILPQKEDKSQFISSDHQNDRNLSLQLSNIQQNNQNSQLNDLSSILHHYNQEEQEANHIKYVYSQMWQDDRAERFNHTYQFHKSKCNAFIERVESMILLPERTVHYTEADIISGLIKMILGVESELFTLDYHPLTWKFSGIPAKFDFILRSSFQAQLQDIFEMANAKSRLQTALSHMKKESYRRILQQVAIQTRQLMIILEEIALEVSARSGSYLDFILTLSEFKSQILLVYELIINQPWIKSQSKSYMDFNVSFLNSEAVMFRQIIRMSNTNDTLMGKGYQLCLNLLRAAFKPITFTLNRVVFEQVTEISNRDDTYLRFYFQNLKDLLSYLGKRIDLIKQDSNQLYMICRSKDQIKIVMETSQLASYIENWNLIFNNKRKLIEQVQKRERKRLKQIKQKKEEDKIKQIYQLRTKLLKSIEETKQRKTQIYLQGVKQIQRLKKDIQQREQRRRLNYLIEKQQQKGFLLEAELKQKRKLINQKQELLAIAEKQGIQLVTTILKEQNIIKQEESKSQKQLIIETKNETELKPEKMKKVLTNQPTIKKEQNLPAVALMQKTTSNASNISIPTQQKIDSQSQQSQQNSIDLDEKQSKMVIKHEESNDIHVSTNTVLELCIDNIIKQQIEITNLALSHLVYDKYQLLNIMEFMRRVFLNGNGEANNNFLHLSVTHGSKINIQFFNECSLFDEADEFIRSLSPEFYQVHSQPVAQSEHQILRRGAGIYQNRQINLFQQSIEISIGFQFSKLPVLLEPYFSYIHLSKYMQIFSHILKIRHCNHLISSCLLSLNEYQFGLDKDSADKNFLKKLYLTRHIIHIYLNTLQSYLFHRVIEKELKVLRTKLKNRDINELSVVHLNMLDFIIRKGLIQNQLNDISKRIKGLLMEVRKFKNIVDSFCANDIHSYVRNQIQVQVTVMHRVFREEQIILESLFYHP